MSFGLIQVGVGNTCISITSNDLFANLGFGTSVTPCGSGVKYP